MNEPILLSDDRILMTGHDLAASTDALTKALHYRGLMTRVAKRMGLNPSHVNRVARGQRQSRRVLEALLSEVERIERRAA